MITKPELMLNLNGDLAREYAARIQYEQHAAVLTGPLAMFAGHLLKHAAEEGAHAQKLNDLIDYHGGIPGVQVAPAFTASGAERMLQINLESEDEAIARYKERIVQATEIGEYGIVAVLLGILADEEHHATDLEAVLGK